MLDIGGGSTEICYLKNKELKTYSIEIGSVRIYEKYFKEGFTNTEINRAKIFIRKSLVNLNGFDNSIRLVGVAGTLTTLSAIKQGLKHFDEFSIHKYILTLNEINIIFDYLLTLGTEERLRLGSFMKGRNDIIVCGALILIEILNFLKIDAIMVSTKGLRYGLMKNIHDFI